MDDALFVRGFERVGDLLRDGQGIGEQPRSTALGFGVSTIDQGRQILALDQLHDQGREISGFLESVDRGDVRVVQRGEHFSFALKTREAIGVAGDGRRQHFDRDRPFQVAVGRAIDLAHATGANGGNNFIWAEARAGGQGQSSRDYTRG